MWKCTRNTCEVHSSDNDNDDEVSDENLCRHSSEVQTWKKSQQKFFFILIFFFNFEFNQAEKC